MKTGLLEVVVGRLFQ